MQKKRIRCSTSLSPRNHDATSFTLLAASFETRSLHRPDCRNEDCLRTRQNSQCQRRRRPDCYAHPKRPTKDCLGMQCRRHHQMADNDDRQPCRSVVGVNCRIRSSLRGHSDCHDVRLDDAFELGKIFLKHLHKLARGGVVRLLVTPCLPRLQDTAVDALD
jgi:hypothetical protein